VIPDARVPLPRYVRDVFVRKAALRPVPDHAIVGTGHVEAVERSLDQDEHALQERLDAGYRELDRKQPALALFLSEELASLSDELVQALGYFLSVTVHMAFREAFPTRLHAVDDGSLRMALETLAADEELRANDPLETLESDDVVAMGQPAVLAFVQHHVEEALEQASDDVNADDVERAYRAILVEVIALSHAVATPSGELGPRRDLLA
jgi:hypothetical protein